MRAARVAGGVLAIAVAGAAALLLRSLAFIRYLLANDAPTSDIAPVTGLSLLSAAAAIGLLASARLPSTRRVGLALALVSGAVGLYAAELLVPPRFRRVARLQGERLLVIHRLRGGGVESYPAPFPLATPIVVGGEVAVPLGGVSRSRTVLCKEAGEWLVYDSDEHGFHNPPGLWSAPDVDVVALGDSFTAGNCVPSGENMVARIRERWPATLNLGHQGNGPLLMLAGVREYLASLRPRVVLWCHFGNDLNDLQREREHPVLRRYLDPAFRLGLLERQDEIDRGLRERLGRALDEAAAVRLPPGLSDFLVLRNLRDVAGLSFGAYGDPTDDDYLLLERILREAKTAVEGFGGTLYFVYLPDREEVEGPRVLGDHLGRQMAGRARRRVLEIAGRLGLPAVDVLEEFIAQPDPSRAFACPGCHYSGLGYRLAAGRVIRALDGAPFTVSSAHPGRPADHR